MGKWISLKASDGHELSAYEAIPEGQAKGGLVIIQEIFGINAHIRGVVERFAKEGYHAVAPALFDRIEPGIELTYEGEDLQRAARLIVQLAPATALADVGAAFQRVHGEGIGAATVGYCYGGLMSWLSATRGSDEIGFTPRCAVGYYPGGIGKFAAEAPKCPVLLHFGAEDDHIGIDQVDAVRQAHPEVMVYLYEGAGHGFNCDARASFSPQAAALAMQRTLGFLSEHLG